MTHYTERYEAAVLRVQESQEEPLPKWDKKVVKRYVEGLRKTLRGLVSARTYDSVEAASQYAIKVEGWQKGDDGEEERPRFRARSTKKVGAVEARAASAKASTPTPAPAPVTRGARTCFRCGKPGHVQANCPTMGTTAPVRRPVVNGATGGAFRCYTCNETGHQARGCPRRNHVFCTKCGRAGHVAETCRQQSAPVGAVSAPVQHGAVAAPAQVGAVAAPAQAPAPPQRD